MLINTRPDWTRATKGAPIDSVVRINGSAQGASGRKDIQFSRGTVSLIRTAALQARPEDEYEVGFVYGPEASNSDVASRSLIPLIRKFVEGYNVTIIVFGATGSGKTFLLEGTRAKDISRVGSDGDGLVHLAADELFKQLHQRAAAVGDQIAQRRRMPTAKAFESFVESTCMEVYNEGVRDLYQRGAAAQAKLPVYEDDLDGYQVSGITYRGAKGEGELRAAYNSGKASRDMGSTDLGSVHERAATIFTVHLAQYAPAAVQGEEDRIMVSRLQFVDMPGAERLAMDPELLRLREGGQLSRSLLSFASVLRELADAGAAGGTPAGGTAAVESSVLTRLLGDAMGGNALTLMVGCLKEGAWEVSQTVCQQLTVARQARTFPVVNHGRARGLLQQLRRRLLSVCAERDTLRDQLLEVPAEGDPNAVAISIAKARDLESRLLAEREEKAALLEEKQALQLRLAKLRDAGTGDLAEKADFQEALIKSEELRLELAKTLINSQMEWNDKESSWAEEKLDLEQRLLELEGSHFERYVRAEEHAALLAERDEINTRLLDVEAELARRDTHIEELKAEVEELKGRLRKAENELNALGGGLDQEDQETQEAEATAEAEAGSTGQPLGETLPGKGKKVLSQLKAKDRRIAELTADLREVTAEMDRARNTHQLSQTGVDEVREAYRRKLETMMRDVGDLARAVAIMQDDPATGLRVKPEDLFNAFQKLTDENLAVTDAREREMRADLDALQSRHVELKRKMRSLYLAYRQLRYLIEDRWPADLPPLEVVNEEQILQAALEEISRTEEEADRRVIARLREQASQMGTQLGALKIADAAAAQGINLRPSNLALAARENTFDTNNFVGMPSMQEMEVEKLRQELDRMRTQAVGTPVDQMRKDNQLLQGQLRELGTDKSRADMAKELAAAKQEMDKLRQQMAGGAAGGLAPNDPRSVAQQIKEFQNKELMELERKLQSSETNKLMAEEQLTSLQVYLTQATVQYQREIVRLRGVIGQMDPGGKMSKADPLRGKA